MKELRFSWDEKKAQSNVLKHKVTFEEAKTAFADSHARLIADPDHSEQEERFILLGMCETSKLLTVVHCYRDDDFHIRIISARKSTKAEQKQYQEFLI
jgi:uncharacterized DUF497 family protein